MLNITEQIINSCKLIKSTEKLFYGQYNYKIVLEPPSRAIVENEKRSYGHYSYRNAE